MGVLLLPLVLVLDVDFVLLLIFPTIIFKTFIRSPKSSKLQQETKRILKQTKLNSTSPVSHPPRQ